jgi:hypothetical protein
MTATGRTGNGATHLTGRCAGRWRVAVLCAGVLLACMVAVPERPASAQAPSVVVEQVIAAGGGGLVSASLDPARRYSLQFLTTPEGTSFQGTYSQNWFAREGARRAGSNETPLRGRTPWEYDLLPPAPALIQWTLAAGIWNDGGGTLLVRLLDHGPR